MVSCHCRCLRSAKPGALGACGQAALCASPPKRLNCSRAGGLGRAGQPGGAPSACGESGSRRELRHRTGWTEARSPPWLFLGGALPSPSPPSCPCRDIRLIEVTENICKRLLDYNLHKERSGSNRFAKVRAVCQSQASLTHPGAKPGFVLPILWIPHQRPACKAALLPKSGVG